MNQMMMPSEDIIGAAMRTLAAHWQGATMLRQMVLLSEFLKTIEPYVSEVNKRYELASQALANTSRPQNWQTIRKLMTFRAHISNDTMRRVTGTKFDAQGIVMQLKALDAAGQKQRVDELFAGKIADQQEQWRQFIGIWSYRRIYPKAPTRENMSQARERQRRRHREQLKRFEKAKEEGAYVGLDVKSGIRRLAKVWNEVPPLARLMFLDEQDRLEAEQDPTPDKEVSDK